MAMKTDSEADPATIVFNCTTHLKENYACEWEALAFIGSLCGPIEYF